MLVEGELCSSGILQVESVGITWKSGILEALAMLLGPRPDLFVMGQPCQTKKQPWPKRRCFYDLQRLFCGNLSEVWSSHPLLIGNSWRDNTTLPGSYILATILCSKKVKFSQGFCSHLRKGRSFFYAFAKSPWYFTFVVQILGICRTATWHHSSGQ